MQNSRRTFLKQAGLGISAAFLSPYLSSCQGGSSGQSPFQNLGLQLFSVRDMLDEDPTTTLATVAKIGYKHVETFGVDAEAGTYWNLPIAELKKVLDDNGLKTLSGHYDLQKYLSKGTQEQENIEKYLEIAHQLGQTYVIAPVPPMEHLVDLKSDDYQYAAEQLNKFGEMAKKAGIKIGYHNHFWEFRQFGNGTKGLDILLAFTEPDLVDFELDLFWIEKAGISPQSYFEKYPGRFPIWHLKDIDKQHAQPLVGDELDNKSVDETTKDIRYTEVGTGTIDFIKLADHADKAGLKYTIVEQDDIYMPNKFESLKKSYDYVMKHLAK